MLNMNVETYSMNACGEAFIVLIFAAGFNLDKRFE